MSRRFTDRRDASTLVNMCVDCGCDVFSREDGARIRHDACLRRTRDWHQQPECTDDHRARVRQRASTESASWGTGASNAGPTVGEYADYRQVNTARASRSIACPPGDDASSGWVLSPTKAVAAPHPGAR